MRKIAIVDIDGCVSDDEWRLSLIDTSKTGEERFSKYHRLAHRDGALAVGKNAVSSLVKEGYEIYFFTARPDSMSELTRNWITCELGVSFPSVWMRKVSEASMSAVDIKRYMIETLIKTFKGEDYSIMAYDDRRDVAEMYDGFHNVNSYIMNCYGVYRWDYENAPKSKLWDDNEPEIDNHKFLPIDDYADVESIFNTIPIADYADVETILNVLPIGSFGIAADHAMHMIAQCLADLRLEPTAQNTAKLVRNAEKLQSAFSKNEK